MDVGLKSINRWPQMRLALKMEDLVEYMICRRSRILQSILEYFTTGFCKSAFNVALIF